LYLNVYAPSTPAGDMGRAVMFWIFGGSLQFGTGGASFTANSAISADQKKQVYQYMMAHLSQRTKTSSS